MQQKPFGIKLWLVVSCLASPLLNQNVAKALSFGSGHFLDPHQSRKEATLTHGSGDEAVHRSDLQARLQRSGKCVKDKPDALPPPWTLPATGGVGLGSPAGSGPLAKVFYINLDESSERRASMERQLNASGVPFERFPAVHAADVKAGLHDADLRRMSAGVADYMQGKWGSIACSLSHRLLYEHILKSNTDSSGTFLVLEDDAVLASEWQSKLQTLLPTLPQNTSAVLCGIWGSIRCSDVISEGLALATNPSWRVEDPEVWYYAGSTGVLLFPKTLGSLLNALSHEMIKDADALLLSKGSVRTYATVDPLTSPNSNFSSERLVLDDEHH